MKLYHFPILQFFCLVYLPLIGCLKYNRDKRYLIFPQANPTRHQFIAGVGIPVDLADESVTIGYVFKAQYFLPYNVSQLRPNPNFFPSHDFYGKKGRRRREAVQSVERYTANVVEIDRKPLAIASIICDESREDVEKRNNFRWDIYKSMEYVNYGLGYHGRECVLRLICEMGSVSFHQSSGILADVIKLVLTPSSTNENLSQSTDIEYRNAEVYGSTGKPCHEIYPKCNLSIRDMFTKLL